MPGPHVGRRVLATFAGLVWTGTVLAVHEGRQEVTVVVQTDRGGILITEWSAATCVPLDETAPRLWRQQEVSDVLH